MFIRLMYISGKNPDWLSSACADYCRRIRKPWTIEQQPLSLSKQHASDNRRAIAEESDRLLKASSQLYRIALTDCGKSMDSRSFARWLQEIGSRHPITAFLVGGPSGFDQRVLEQSNEQLSLSAMTLPHALCRLLLCEQIYRANTIVLGGSYHK